MKKGCIGGLTECLFRTILPMLFLKRSTARPLATSLHRMTIEEMDLSVRPYNCLRRAGISTLYELTQMTENDLIKVRNLGRRSMAEVIRKMQEYGVSPKAE